MVQKNVYKPSKWKLIPLTFLQVSSLPDLIYKNLPIETGSCVVNIPGYCRLRERIYNH